MTLFKSAIGASTEKQRYLSYTDGHELLSNFTTAANRLIQKSTDLQKCTKPKDNSLQRFMNGEIDSYGKPVRRRY